MNILLVNHYAGSVYHGMEYRPYYLAREWVRSGHNVTIVAADQSHLRSIQLSMDASIRCEKIDGISYIWLKTTKYEGNGIQRAINMASFVAGIFRFNKQIIKIGKPDVVVASSTYPLDIFPCHFLAKRSDAKLIYEIHDLWPLSPMELGNMPWYHPFILCMQVAENWCYKYCDAVVSILPKVLDHVTSHGLTPEKLHIVPNGITDFWLGSHRPKMLKGNDEFSLVYAGDFTVNKNIVSILTVLERLIANGYKVHFEAIGLGRPNEQASYVRKVKNMSKNVDYIKLTPAMCSADLLKKYCMADIFIMISHTETFGLVYAEALSQGLPIVYTKGQGIDGTFPDKLVGRAVDSRDLNDIYDGIRYVIENYNELIGNIAGLNFDQIFGWKFIANDYKQIYESCCC